MEIPADLISLGIAMALGLLIGMQRERTDSAIAGVRTFALITMLGALAAIAQREVGAWVFAAGLIVTVGATIVGEALLMRTKTTFGGMTTSIAVGVMYVVGGLCALDHRATAAAAAGVTYLLLQAKGPLHRVIGRMSDTDIRAISIFVLITLVILPLLPDQDMGPYGALNPRSIWRLVVLVVSVSLLGYVIHKVVGSRGGVFISGVLGGLISSTATTVGMARRARHAPSVMGPAVVALIATAIVYARLATIVGLASPRFLPSLGGPFAVMFITAAVCAVVAYLRIDQQEDGLPEQSNPTELRAALVFAAIYAAIRLLTAFARDQFGNSGLFAVASISGLVDMDAITLSVGQMVQEGSADSRHAWQAVVVAAMSNLVCKGAFAWAMGGVRFGRIIATMFAVQAIVGILLIWLWPWN